jgi:hypothetical protein
MLKTLLAHLKEGRMMVEAARYQASCSTHDVSQFRACERNGVHPPGKIGKALMAKAWMCSPRPHRSQRRRPGSGGRRFRYLTAAPSSCSIQTVFTTTGTGIETTARAMWATTECINRPCPLLMLRLRRRDRNGPQALFDDDQKTPDTVNVTFEYKDSVMLDGCI